VTDHQSAALDHLLINLLTDTDEAAGLFADPGYIDRAGLPLARPDERSGGRHCFDNRRLDIQVCLELADEILDSVAAAVGEMLRQAGRLAHVLVEDGEALGV
jgi:hypothetical protein